MKMNSMSTIQIENIVINATYSQTLIQHSIAHIVIYAFPNTIITVLGQVNA